MSHFLKGFISPKHILSEKNLIQNFLNKNHSRINSINSISELQIRSKSRLNTIFLEKQKILREIKEEVNINKIKSLSKPKKDPTSKPKNLHHNNRSNPNLVLDYLKSQKIKKKDKKEKVDLCALLTSKIRTNVVNFDNIEELNYEVIDNQYHLYITSLKEFIKLLRNLSEIKLLENIIERIEKLYEVFSLFNGELIDKYEKLEKKYNDKCEEVNKYKEYIKTIRRNIILEKFDYMNDNSRLNNVDNCSQLDNSISSYENTIQKKKKSNNISRGNSDSKKHKFCKKKIKKYIENLELPLEKIKKRRFKPGSLNISKKNENF